MKLALLVVLGLVILAIFAVVVWQTRDQHVWLPPDVEDEDIDWLAELRGPEDRW